MKPKFRSISSLASLFAVVAFSTTAASAATLYWDGGTVNIGSSPNGNGVSAGNLGNWDTTITNWDQGNALTHVAWNNATFDTAFFGGTAGLVTLTAPITVGGLSFFSNSGYTIAAGASGLTFGATNNTISLVNQTTLGTSSATISGTVAGNNVSISALNRNVASTLNFTGNTAGGYTGTTTVGANTFVTLDGATSFNRNLLNTSGITLNGGAIDSGVLANNANGSANRINDLANWTVNNGTFTWGSSNSGGTYAETLGTVALTTGQMNFVLRGNLSSGSQTLTLTNLTQAGTSAVTFSNAATAFDSSVGSATDVIRVTGAASTPAGQIIGPWATIGSAAGNQTDYARYLSDGIHGYVVTAAGTLTAPGEGGWGSATTAYQFAASETLTNNRTAAALRSTGATPTIALGGFTLSTNGILAGNGPLTVSGLGALTATGGAGGNLYLTAGNNAITVSSIISNNGGAVTVVKNGASNLTLSSTSNSYTGGIVVNAGTLTWTANTNLGAAAGDRDITVNGTATLAGFTGTSLDALTVGSGGVATLSGLINYTFASASGSGTIITQGGQNGIQNIGNASAFTGNLALAYASNNNAGLYTNPHLQFSSLNDAVGSAIQIYRAGGGTDSGQIGQVGLTGNAGSVTFNNRQIQLLPRTGTSNASLASMVLVNNNATAANNWVINTPLLNLVENNVIFHLAGTNTGDNAFNGTIGNSASGTALSLTKGSVGTWFLGGSNTYTGATTVTTGRLSLSNINAIANSASVSVASGATLGFAVAGTYATAGTISIAGTGATLPGGAGALWFGVGGSYASILNAPINMTAAATIGSFGNVMTQTLGGAITGTGPLTISSQGGTVNDTATWTIGSVGNASSYTGNTLFTNNNGLLDITVKLGVTNALPVGTSLSLQAATVTLAHNAFTTFDLNGFNQTLAGLTDATGAASVGATFNKRVINSSGTLSNLTINNAGAVLYGTTGTRVTAGTIGGLTAAGAAAHNVALTKNNVGTLTLSGANTYTGATTVNAGTLQAGVASVANVSGAFGNNSAVTMADVSTAILNITGFSTQIGSLTGGGATGGNVVLGAATLTIGGDNTSPAAYAGSISGIGGGLAKIGSGTLTLSSASNYSGSTVISNGTLSLTGSLTGGGAISTNTTGIISQSAAGLISGASTVGVGGSGSSVLAGNNTYSGLTIVSGSATLTLSGNNIGAIGGVTLSTSGTGSSTPRLNVNSATALGTGTLLFGGGAATDTVRLDNTSLGLVNVSTNNVFTLNRNFTFIGTQSLDLGNMTTTLGGLSVGTQRTISVTANTLTFGGPIGEAAANLGINKTGAGTLVFNGLVSYTGVTTIGAGGSLQLGSGSTTGRLSATSTITNNGNLTINRSNAFTQASDLGAGVAITGTGSFTQAGAGTTTLTANNTYQGVTTISAGTLSAVNIVVSGGSSNLGNAASAVVLGSAAAQGTLSYTGNSNTYTRGFTIGGAGGGRLDVTTSGQTLAVSTGNVTGTGLFTVGGAGNTTVNSNLTHTGGLTKANGGTLTISATSTGNTYTGATTVTGGILAVNGILANTSTTVQSGATLQGSGTIGGSVTVQGGGTLASGNSIQSLATGALSLAALSTFAYEADKDAAATAAGDLTAVTGNLTLDVGNAAILTLTDLGSGTWSAGEKLTLISYSGTWNGGLFDFGGSTLADDSTFTFSGISWIFNYNDLVAGSNFTGDLTTPNYVTMTVVPEPRAALLGAIGLLALLRRRR